MIMKMLTFFILMDFPINIDTQSMDLSILYFKGSKFLNTCINIVLSLISAFILANSRERSNSMVECLTRD